MKNELTPQSPDEDQNKVLSEEQKPGSTDEAAPAIFKVFDNGDGLWTETSIVAPFDGAPVRFEPSLMFSEAKPAEYPESGDNEVVPYFPAEPFTVVTTAAADEESGHEFVLHNNREEERYYVFFFVNRQDADDLRMAYTAATGTPAQVVKIPPRKIEERFGVRFTDASGKQIDMPIADYWRNIEIKNEFRRDD